jgi:hypothetical protein
MKKREKGQRERRKEVTEIRRQGKRERERENETEFGCFTKMFLFYL